MKSIKASKNTEIKLVLNNPLIKLSLLNIKSSINSLYSKKKQYNQIIQHELLIKKLSENIDTIFNIRNKHYIQFIKNINYINDVFFDEEKKFENYKYKFKDRNNVTNFWFAIDSIILLKKCINKDKHIFLKKYFKILLLLRYFEIISLNFLKLILEIYIKIIIDLIINDDENIFFLDDLIEGIISFLKKNTNEDKNILYFIITIFLEFISSNNKLTLIFQKSTIFLKFLNYKSCEDKYENDIMLISFLSRLYKNNITTNLLYNDIYKYGILDLNYYSNSISLLSTILREEYNDKMNNGKFIIRKGFYIYKNNPILLNNIYLKKKELSIIFSFKLINEDENDINIFSFTSCSKNSNNVLSFFLCKNKNKDDNYYIKITSDKSEWIINDINIYKNNDYIICITRENISNKNTELNLYINSDNKNGVISYKKFVKSLPNKSIDEVKLKLGENNFEGIIGDFFIINKKLIEEDIPYLFNLNSYYSIIAENIDVITDLINHLNYFYLNNSENIAHFKKLNFFCLLKIGNYNYINNKEINDYTIGNIKYIDERQIEIFLLNDTLNIFINGNGVEFLVFQLHNLFSIFDKVNIAKDELFIFNLFLHQTLKLYYDIIIMMSNEGKKHFILNNSLHFDYFFLSFFTILDYYQKINKYLRMNLDIYNLLLDFVTFCDNNFCFEQRNLILSILLDEKIFNLKILIKESKILENLDFILTHILDEDDEELFDDEILYKILNLQFILTSNEYNHKLYMKIILSLISSKESILEKIFNYFTNLKSEEILYHYLKTILINFDQLNLLIKCKNIYNKFIDYIVNYTDVKENCNCDYCFKIYILISLFKNKFNIENNIKIKNAEVISFNDIKKLIYEIKMDFIICFDLSFEQKFKFVKNNYNNNNTIDKSTNKINKKLLNLSEFNLIQKINKEKFITKLNFIIKKINYIYNKYSHFDPNIKESVEKLIKFNIFEIFKFFLSEIISKRKIDLIAKKLFAEILTRKNEMIHFFKIYLVFDYTNALEFLNFIITKTITKITLPFYFTYMTSDEVIDNNNPRNNIKIKKGIILSIINIICKIEKFDEVININREKILIIVKDKYIKEKTIPNDEEKFIIGFIVSLTIKKLMQYNYFYLIHGEYYNFFELQIDILFEMYKINKYSEQYMNIIYGFLLSSKNDSNFYLNDIKMIKNEKKERKNSSNNINMNIYNDRIYIPNIINTLYFLIYFLFKKKEEQKEKEPNQNKIKFINALILIWFNNCNKIFEYIHKNKLDKKYLIKITIPKLEIYTILYNYFLSKKKNNTIEELEKFFNEILIANNNNINNINNNSTPKTKGRSMTTAINKETMKKIMISNNSRQYHSHMNLNIYAKDINEIKEETNKNEIVINTSKIINKKDFNIKSLLKKKNIPLIYYNKLINNKQDSYTKFLSKPKSEFFWKTFIYALKDTIFHNKNFIYLSKSFKAFTKNLILEQSSKEEDNYFLNYPTKIKNFICDDYYRPFLKPDLKFFDRNLIKISHSYVPGKKFDKILNKFNINKINFINFLPINNSDEDNKDNQTIICENISSRGGILGNIHIKENFLFFKDNYDTILQKTRADPLFFAYSFQDIINHVKILDKAILILYKDIKEIFLRRFFLKRFGYEIFLKDGRSYLFNFFNSENFNKFNELISKKGIKVINDPVKTFEKKDYKNKYKKGELTNFQYLLLLNKYSSRTYNDINQYLVFPVLYMNFETNIKRDLSKAICLNKDEEDLELNKFIENYTILGYYFNNHYSTSAYVLYYLVRLVPYTYMMIDFQSGKFDVPERIFNNYNSYCFGIVGSTENRELIPELFHSYETCLNLNKNNFGKMNFTRELINNFNSNKYKNTIEFIINHRKILENANIVPWINNIFGYNQINETKEAMNVFPLSSYEQCFDINIQKIKEKFKDQSDFDIYRQIRFKLAILDIGISPIQMFKTPHPEKNLIGTNNNNEIKFYRNESNSSNSLNSSSYSNKSQKEKKKIEKKESDRKIIKLFSNIEEFISKQNVNKYKLYLNEESMNLFFIFENKIIIHNILNTNKDILSKIKYPIILDLHTKLINLELNYPDSSRNIIIELTPGFFCICRNENKTLTFMNYSQKYLFSFLWTSIITSIESLLDNKTNSKFFGCDYTMTLFFGDEQGFLCSLRCIYEYIFNDNEIKQPKLELLQKIKLHKNSINIIKVNKRLNIIVTSCLNGDVAINNAENLETLNMIKIGKEYMINNIRINIYDLIYFECYNKLSKQYYIKCFTLNGIKVTQMKTDIKIINFFINESIFVQYENNKIGIFSLYDFNKNEKNEEDDDLKDNIWDDSKIELDKIIHCIYCKKIKKLIKVNDKNVLILDDLN